MMTQSRAESTRDTYNYGQYLNQFPPNTIKVIREFERIQKRICRHKMSIMFNEICIYIYIYIYIYIRVVQKVLSLAQKKKEVAEYLCCGNTLPLLIKLEKLILFSVLISLTAVEQIKT